MLNRYLNNFKFRIINIRAFTMCAKILLLIFLTVLINIGAHEEIWKQDRRPRIMGDRLSLKSISPFRRKVRNNIVRFHNVFRSKVKPTAANMLKMKWNREVAKTAQRWAKQCQFLVHDNITGRYVHNYGSCGQNIFVSSHQVPWFFAIQTWFLEKDLFTYGSDDNNLKNVGHYTQLVWASSHSIGCGLAKCYQISNQKRKQYFNYVCNYCPAGNRPGYIGRPYREGRPCDLCKKQCHSNLLCTNPCYVADLWVNCGDLYKIWPNWLCNETTNKGKDRLKHCLATCTCINKIYD